MAEWKKLEPALNFLGQAGDVANRILNPFSGVMPSLNGLGIGLPTATTSNSAPVYITVNAPSVAAQDVIKSLQGAARSKGVSLQSLLR